VIPVRLVDARTLGLFSRGIVVLAIAVGGIVLFCFVRMYLSLQAIKVNEIQITQAKAGLVQMNQEIEAARNLKEPKANDPRLSVFNFQSAVEASAQANGATVEEYSSSPETLPYLSKYHNETPAPGWQQVPARVHLSGRMPEVFATIKALQNSTIPFEIDTIELTRSQSSKGQSRVIAQLNLRVLVRG
jgi:hypothetical protein